MIFPHMDEQRAPVFTRILLCVAGLILAIGGGYLFLAATLPSDNTAAALCADNAALDRAEIAICRKEPKP